jgi:hypothetical protein
MTNVAGRRAKKSAAGPDPADPALGPERIKHLEFIQAVIARLAGNSFLAKGWAMTVASAVYGFAASRLSPGIAAIGMVPVAAFWLLDAYFLRHERLYRFLYDDVRRTGVEVEPFSMDIQPYSGEKWASWRDVTFSMTLAVFYGMLLAVGLALVLAGVIHGAGSAHAARTLFAASSLT